MKGASHRELPCGITLMIARQLFRSQRVVVEKETGDELACP